MRKPISFRCLAGVGASVLVASLAAGCGKSSKNPVTPGPTTGSVYLRSIPSTAKVLLNGSWVGNLTPQLWPDLTAGTYALTFQMIGYKDTTVSFNIQAGLTETLTVALPPLPGTARSFSTWKNFSGITWGVAVGPSGKIYALAEYKYWVFSATGQTLAQVALPWQQPAYSLAVNSLGQAYFGHDAYLYEYSDAGVQLAKIGQPPGGVSRFPEEPHPAVGRNDTIVVAVQQRDLPLYRFHNDTQQGSFWPSVDSTLYAIAIDRSDGTIYGIASDRNSPVPSRRVLKFSPGGQLLAQWVTAVRGALTVAPDGSVYVAGVDEAWVSPDGGGAGRIQHFSSSGNLLAEWGVENAVYHKGSFEIFGLAVDASGNIYATDFNGRRIIKFEP